LQGAFGQAQALGQSALAKPGIDEAGGQAQMQALRSKRLATSSARAALRSAMITGPSRFDSAGVPPSNRLGGNELFACQGASFPPVG